jgi:hypothetical protein
VRKLLETIVVLFGCWFIIHGNIRAQTSDPSYNLPFGSNPYAPSRARAGFSGFLKPSDFPSAQYCSRCHQQIHQQWRESAHANSFRAPFYLKNVQLLIDQKGIEYTRHCEACHNPVALFTGTLTKGSTAQRPFDDEGVTCEVCHAITKIDKNVGIGSYELGWPTVMVNPDGSPRTDIPSYSEILERPDLHKKAVMRDLLNTPEFCSVCHKAALPPELNGYKWLRAFSVYDEWQQSSWSRESPLPFYQKDKASTCQNCHMPLELSEDRYVAKDGKISSHRFPGANTAIPTYYSYPDQIEAVRKLMSNTLNLDFVAISLKHKGSVSETTLINGAPLRISPGDEITVDLVIQNRGIGHSLVPEQRDFYESWVEFTAAGEEGKLLAHSGGLNQDGSLDQGAHSYTNRLIDRSGNGLLLHQVWNARLKTYDNTIMSGRSDLVRYRFQIPDHTSGVITISAAVRYRRFRQQYTDFILDRHSSYPILELGATKLALKIGKHQYQAAPEPKQTLLRWNNYGIALLGQQQWWRAADAFRQTMKIDRGFIDGYINTAIAESSKWIEAKKENPDGPGVFSLDNANAPPEKFAPALDLLNEALALSPNSARALFYKGLILRLQNHLDEAAANFMEVIKQYPDMRQGHQELGYVLYLKKDYKKAANEFEAVKDINPDDITACYYLSIIYPNLGKTREAEKNAKLYSEHRDDPNNYALNLDFVKTHPNETLELIPYHVHGR